MKLLLSGDLHIGRTSSRLPGQADAARARAAEAWLRIVQLAIEQQVQAVCLAGDVIDASNRFWEALGPLERGIQELAKAGIHTLAVAGNHDHHALPRVAQRMDSDHFILLGQQGQWQRHTLEHDGQRLHIDGWSFPQPSVTTNPLADYQLPTPADGPVLGMVHGDLGNPASVYAPLDLSDLHHAGPQGWLLGHIHAPRLHQQDGRPWVLYPGSPQAMDPGEPGLHGVRLLQVEPRRLGLPDDTQVLPTSSVWYEPLTICLDGLTTEPQIDTAIQTAIRQRVDQLRLQVGQVLEAISLRISLVGHTPLAHHVREVTAAHLPDYVPITDTVAVGIDRVQASVLPPLNLKELAHHPHTATGALARLLLELEQPHPDRQAADLLARAGEQIALADIGDLPPEPMDDAQVRSLLAEQARALLTELLHQTRRPA